MDEVDAELGRLLFRERKGRTLLLVGIGGLVCAAGAIVSMPGGIRWPTPEGMAGIVALALSTVVGAHRWVNRTVSVFEGGVEEGGRRLAFHEADEFVVEVTVIDAGWSRGTQYRFRLGGERGGEAVKLGGEFGNLGPRSRHLDAILDRACPPIRDRLAARLRGGEEVAWGKSLRLAPRGLRARTGALFPYAAIQSFAFDQAHLDIRLLDGTAVRLHAKERNFYPGYALFGDLVPPEIARRMPPREASFLRASVG